MIKRILTIFNNSKKDIDGIIIKNSGHPFIDDNFFYVTGLDKGIFEGCVSVLHPSGEMDLIVSELEGESAKRIDGKNVHIHTYKSKDDFENIMKKSTSSMKKIGLNFGGILYRDFCKLREKFTNVTFVDVSDAFAKARAVKDDLEIDLIRKACDIADKTMDKIPDLLHEGIPEYEIAAEIDYLMQKNGADKPAFETISSFGKNTAEPHYSHGKTKLKKGDFALFDFGAYFKKYNSDMTRTFVFGKCEKKQREMYETVLEAQRIGLDKSKAGIKAYEVHQAVSSFIDHTKFKGRFIHSTGHALGLAVHDLGVGFTQDCEVELKENMVLTVEPGIYIPGFGGVRIEDDVLVKKDGVELLTKSSREFIEI